MKGLGPAQRKFLRMIAAEPSGQLRVAQDFERVQALKRGGLIDEVEPWSLGVGTYRLTEDGKKFVERSSHD